MRKLFILFMCLFAMLAASTSLKAQEVTITLNPGWTWISYLGTEPQNFATALGSFTPEVGDVIKSQWGNATYMANGQWKGSITQFYPGYGYMYKSARAYPVALTLTPQQPATQVVVTTSEPMLITGISAMGGGEVTTNDGTYILVKGLCWATHENPTTNEDFFQEAESGVGSFSISMTGLNIATTYYVRAYAVTPNGTVYGDQKAFTTRDGIPTVTTDTVTSITGVTASCGGTVTDNGGLNVTARGVCWSTSQNPTLSDSHTTNGSGLGSFTSSITGLTISTTYYVRAYATTSAGIGYGEQESFTTRNGIPTVTTVEVTSIGCGWAYSGGNITDDGGLAVTARGVCWSTSPSPTLADSHTSDGIETGSFVSHITGLSLNTTYYVRSYATNSFVTVYGNQLNFTTLDDYEYVDLGLPSGLLWATCNVGAEMPEDYGDYFAWGETQPKAIYDFSTYLYCNGDYDQLTKYNFMEYYGYNGFTDNLTTLLPEDDAATANWTANWRIPIAEEWLELCNNTTHTWTIQNGVSGRLFTASNGNSIFLPAAGYREGSNLYYADSYGGYWSSSQHTNSYPFNVEEFDFSSNGCSISNACDRCYGLSIRPVRCKSSVVNVTINPTEGGELNGGGTYVDHTSCTVSATVNEGYTFLYWTENGYVVSTDTTYTFNVCGNKNLVANFTYIGVGVFHEYVDLGLPSGLLWATCNVGAESPEDYGVYFAWGESHPKGLFRWNTYQYSNGGVWDNPNFIKYCNNSNYGYNGFTDNLTTLLPEDDAAMANWGPDWRMPTSEEWNELLNYTTNIWTTQNGVKGQLFTASNGNSLFLPAAGFRYDGGNWNANWEGCYWSSSLNTDNPRLARSLDFYSDESPYEGGNRRCYGVSVRPVRSASQN